MNKLSVVLATYNEEKNIRDCLESIKNIADEIVIVDGSSTDKTVEIAKDFGAKVLITNNPPNFHINKQKALELAKNEWILQLDADERVSGDLAGEIKKIIQMSDMEIDEYQKTLKNKKLFLRHQVLLEKRDGNIGTKNGEYAAFFVPRLNYFLGRYLRYGGVYPDGVIRLLKNGKAHFPLDNINAVHMQPIIDGKVGWLQNDLLHIDSPTFSKYKLRWQRYTTLMAKELKEKNVGYNPIVALQYFIFWPIWWFLLTFIRYKGFLESWQGFVFYFFSSIRFPVAYIKYLKLRL